MCDILRWQVSIFDDTNMDDSYKDEWIILLCLSMVTEEKLLCNIFKSIKEIKTPVERMNFMPSIKSGKKQLDRLLWRAGKLAWEEGNGWEGISWNASSVSRWATIKEAVRWTKPIFETLKDILGTTKAASLELRRTISAICIYIDTISANENMNAWRELEVNRDIYNSTGRSTTTTICNTHW